MTKNGYSSYNGNCRASAFREHGETLFGIALHMKEGEIDYETYI